MKHTQHFSHGGIGSFKAFLHFFYPSHYVYKRPDRPKWLSARLINMAMAKRERKYTRRLHEVKCGGWRTTWGNV